MNAVITIRLKQLLSESCLIVKRNNTEYYVATRRVLNIDRKILCRDLHSQFGFKVSQRRLKALLPFYVKFGSTTSWANQALCSQCFNIDYTLHFMQKLGQAACDSLLTIISYDGLQTILCCGGEIDPRVCYSVLNGKKCFVHSKNISNDCKGSDLFDFYKRHEKTEISNY